MARRDFTQTNLRLPMRVWDLPVRLFHWIVVALIICSYVTDRMNWIQLHLVSGFTMLAMLLFRLVWGLVGSDTARFSSFLRSPIAGLRHLAAFGRREPDDQIGHNEAGGWMVLVMLLLLAVQVGTGLFSNNDGSVQGPLAQFVGKDGSDWFSSIHAMNFNILLGVIGLHILAILAYAVIKKHDLVRPMFTGKKRLPAATPAPRMASSILAAVIFAVAAIAAWAIATQV
jgi:cytochrome b